MRAMINYDNLIFNVAEINVLIAIFDVNGYMPGYISYDSIATKCNLTRPAVAYNIKKLAAAGIIEVSKNGLQIISDGIIQIKNEG